MVAPYANSVYASHRRGTYIMKRYRNGLPLDLSMNWSRRKVGYFLNRYFPTLAAKAADVGLRYMMRKMYGDKLDPSWGLDNAAPAFLAPHVLDDCVITLLAEGKVQSRPGISRFTGPKSVEFTDGTTLEDIDAVICCTGYGADFSLTPFIEMSAPAVDNKGKPYSGGSMARLYMNIFPPAHADSIAILAYSGFGKNNGFSFSDVTSMAISNIWRGVSADMLPSRADMERKVDSHQAWVASRYNLFPLIDLSMVKQWEFQGFLHEAAGTGLENLGWGWKGWLFMLKDPKMSWLMNQGVETAHAFRFFETGKRKTWPGARDAIIHMNELVKAIPKQKD